MFKEKEGEILAPPDVDLTLFQRQVMLAYEIELLIERDGTARVTKQSMEGLFLGVDSATAQYLREAAYFGEIGGGWFLPQGTGVWTITPGKEGERCPECAGWGWDRLTAIRGKRNCSKCKGTGVKL